ncbi:MAG: trypsin-like peptidase domain-containing protein [Pseudomonadota bacterium]|nr:trypsin-like peptidase domain-containing protein [Pseudomonadota bacterium]
MSVLRTTVLMLMVGSGVAGCGAIAGSPTPVQMPAGFNPMVSLAPLVDAVEPAVVNVYTSGKMQVDPRTQWMFGLPSERTVQGQGSGFVISADGYILTNNHVVKDATEVKVKFADGADYAAKVVGTDADSDIALLKITGNGAFPYLQLDKDDGVRVGDWVVAVGNPLGFGHTVTAGIVSGMGRNIPDLPLDEFIQTDASINPGNSGGPLIGLDGTVVGMNTAILAGANTVGFAIPASHIYEVIPQLRENGRVSRGYMGVQMASIPEVAQQALGKGVLIAEVVPDGPAAKAGIQSGDVVVKIGSREVEDQTDMLRVVAGTPPGEKVDVLVMRKGKEKKLTVELMEKPDAAKKAGADEQAVPQRK